MALRDYDEERIWRRLNKKLDLKKFKKAKTEKQRRKAFRDALRKDKFGKNILRMQPVNFQKVLDFSVAQQLIDDGKAIQASVKRFKEKRRKRVTSSVGQLRTLDLQEKLLKRAEKKGFKVREVKERIAPIGRPTTQKTLVEGVKFSKAFKFGKRIVRGIYIKGRRGAIALEEVKE
ncbi:hypothetical protein LCGC14_0700190 [marine sediment metagenome]|uniref:Uncharacterized protein n=1 Tax=marine sediment metagenome TaxID=412755 RepID=A0A0F9R3D0_9ZZZZ